MFNIMVQGKVYPDITKINDFFKYKKQPVI